jgi:arginine/lysine/ornithine decarboxylase
LKLTNWLRNEIKEIQGLRLLGEELVGGSGCFDFDPTKVTINVSGLGMSGYEVENILRSRYKLQVELSDLYNVIFLITLADTWETVTYLSACLRELAAHRLTKKVIKLYPPVPEIPPIIVSPREAFYSQAKVVSLQDAAGEISAESIMAYPPGIPLICPGEKITQGVIDYVYILKQEHADLQGTEDPEINSIKVLKRAAVKRIVERNLNQQYS